MRLRLYYPLKPFVVNQHFGDNLPCVKDFGLPTQSIVTGVDAFTCPPGYDKLYQHFGMSGHNGTDLNSGEQYIYASCDGVVVEKQTVPARGLGIGILTNEQYDFGGLSSHYVKIRYWHLKEFRCEVGDQIKVGQVIGVSDSTGYSSGNHLHFEGNLFDKDQGGHPVQVYLPGNIAGAIDLEPYFTGIYAEDYTTLIDRYNALVGLLKTLLGSLAVKN